MGRIQSSVGLVTGVPIEDTVNQLMAVAARPRDLITARNKDLQSQQVAVTQLSSLILAVKLSTDALGKSDIFQQRSVQSSNAALLAATVTGTPPLGTFTYTPVRHAQAHQLLSSTIGDLDEPVGAGSFSFRRGGFVDRAAALSTLNGGAGIERGRIRITDRSGASAIIDLRFAQSIDDVLAAINTNDDVNVTAETVGDTIRLVDNTGQTSSNLIVQEVASGSTAADLGLGSINVAANSATGSDVLSLYDSLALASLNDGTGVALRDALPDLAVTFADGSATLNIDLGEAVNIGQVVAAINAADPARLTAAISADGDHIELTDLTSGVGTFAVSSLMGGTAAEDLGLTETAVSGVITGARLQGGLKTVLLSSLGGGTGLGSLGLLQLTDRSGSSNLTVDLSNAETLDDVLAAINGAGVDIVASLNAARSGIVLTDTSGGVGNLIVASGDANDTAEKLGIEVSAAVSSIDGGSLHLQTASYGTLLSTLRGGEGVQSASFVIRDSNGDQGVVKLNQTGAEITTLGGVIDAINALTIGVTARINDTGDGIWIEDTAGGTGTLNVREVGSGTTASDLKILGDASVVDVGGTPTQVIDGTSTITIDFDADDTLSDVIERINDLDAGVKATSFFDGIGYRMALASTNTGKAAELQIDTTSAPFTFQETAKAQDALLLYGSPANAAAGILIPSASGKFSGVLEGVDLVVKGTSTEAVNINVTSTNAGVVSKVNAFVDAYNALRDALDKLTAFNEVDNTVGALFGSSEALRVESGFSDLVTRRFFGVGDIQSLETVGISLNETGQMTLDTDKLESALAADPAAVEQFFTDEDLGVSAKFDALIESLSEGGNSVLASRSKALADRVKLNEERIDAMTARLDKQRERLLNEFYQMEIVIGKMKNSLSAVQSIKAIPPLVSTSNS